MWSATLVPTADYTQTAGSRETSRPRDLIRTLTAASAIATRYRVWKMDEWCTPNSQRFTTSPIRDIHIGALQRMGCLRVSAEADHVRQVTDNHSLPDHDIRELPCRRRIMCYAVPFVGENLHNEALSSLDMSWAIRGFDPDAQDAWIGKIWI